MSKSKSNYVLLNYIPTTHALQRIEERFGIPPTEVANFLRENQESGLTETPLEENTGGKRVGVRSKNGIMFVLDVENKTIVTVYQSVSPDIVNERKVEFDERLVTLVRETNVRLAKDMVASMKEHIDRFNQNVEFISAHEPNEIDMDKIDEIVDDIQLIRTTMRIYNIHRKQFEQHLANVTQQKAPEPTSVPPVDTYLQSIPAVTAGGIGTSTHGSIVMENLKPKSKQELNNWGTKVLGTTMSKTLFNIIRDGATKETLLAKMKPQLTVITFRKFEHFIDGLVARDVKGV